MSKWEESEYAKGKDTDKVRFAEIFCTSRKTDFDARLKEAEYKTGQRLDDPEVRELIHLYLSFFRYNQKYQMLLTYQLTMWRVSRLILDAELGEDVENQTKSINLMDKMTDLTWKLSTKVQGLLSEIYGEDQVQDIATEQIVKAISPEQRMKKKQVVAQK